MFSLRPIVNMSASVLAERLDGEYRISMPKVCHEMTQLQA